MTFPILRTFNVHFKSSPILQEDEAFRGFVRCRHEQHKGNTKQPALDPAIINGISPALNSAVILQKVALPVPALPSSDLILAAFHWRDLLSCPLCSLSPNSAFCFLHSHIHFLCLNGTHLLHLLGNWDFKRELVMGVLSLIPREFEQLLVQLRHCPAG